MRLPEAVIQTAYLYHFASANLFGENVARGRIYEAIAEMRHYLAAHLWTVDADVDIERFDFANLKEDQDAVIKAIDGAGKAILDACDALRRRGLDDDAAKVVDALADNVTYLDGKAEDCLADPKDQRMRRDVYVCTSCGAVLDEEPSKEAECALCGSANTLVNLAML